MVNNLTHPEVFYALSLPVFIIFIGIIIQHKENKKNEKKDGN